jgi:hypothetical protein
MHVLLSSIDSYYCQYVRVHTLMFHVSHISTDSIYMLSFDSNRLPLYVLPAAVDVLSTGTLTSMPLQLTVFDQSN